MRDVNDRSASKDTEAYANMLSYEDIRAILYMKRREEALEGFKQQVSENLGIEAE